MSTFAFAVNSRHQVAVALNTNTGLCDVQVSDQQSPKTFVKSMVLEQYNKMVDWLKENDHGYAMTSIQALF